MLRRVIIKKGKGGVSDFTPASYNQKQLPTNTDRNRYGTPDMSVRSSLTSVPREEADLEAEGGETVVTNLNNDGIPEHYNIKGPRHTNGGVPLKLPAESFIYSDTKDMRICDAQLLTLFGFSVEKGKKCYTPADLAKKFNLNEYKKVLLDPDADKLQKSTAEMMIANFNKKLAQIALAQEAKKGFPDGIPSVAEPILAEYQMDPNELMGTQGEEDMQPEEEGVEMAKYGKQVGRRVRVSLPKAQNAGQTFKKPSRYEDYEPKTGWSRGSITPEERAYEQEWLMNYQYPKYNYNPNTSSTGRMYSGFPMPYGNPYYPYVSNPYMPYYYEQGVPVNNQRGYGAFNLMDAGSMGSRRYTTSPRFSTKTTKKQNIPAGATTFDESSSTYDPSKVKAGDYVKGKDGKWRKATGSSGGTGLSGGSMSGAENYKKFYGTDPKSDAEKAKQMLDEKIKQGVKGITKKDGKYNFTDGAQDSLTLEEKSLLTKLAGYGNKEQYGAKEFGLNLGKQWPNKYGFVGFVDPELVEFQNWKSRKENWNKTEKDFKALSPEDKKANRLEYLKKTGYSDQEIKNLGDKINDPSKLYTKEFVGSPENKSPNTLVARTQTSFPKEQFRPFKEDDYMFGWEHADFYRRAVDPSMQFEDVPEEDVTETVEEPGADYEYPVRRGESAPWFAQDVVNVMGSARDFLGRKKYNPWWAVPNYDQASPTFVDYTRALAGVGEQAGMATQGATAFSGPQRYGANASRIYGQSAAKVADLLAQEANQNVDIANQFELANSQLMNQYAGNLAGLATQGFDKQTIANQMYDAERDQAREALRRGYMAAITNRANAQVLNSLYPQYDVDPSSGGTLTFTGGRDPYASQANDQDILGEMTNLRGLYPGWTERAYLDAAKQNLGIKDPYDPYQRNIYQAQQQALMENVDPYS